MRSARNVALLAVLAAVAGCGEADEGSAPPASPPPPTWELVAAPDWVQDFCRDADRVIRGRLLCLGRVPTGLQPTANLAIFRPLPRGYLVEGEADRHWVVGALQPGELRDFGPPRELGLARIRGRRARWSFAEDEGGIFAGHLILSWREGAFVYAVSVHGDPELRELRAQVRAVAAAMRRYP